MEPLEEGRGRRREHHRVGRADATIRAASTARVRASSSHPATARRPAPRPPRPENFRAFAAESAVEPQERRIGPHTGDRALADCFRLCLQAFAPVLTDRTLTAFREFVNMLTILAPAKRGKVPSRGRRALMSMDIFRDDALAGKSILVTGGGGGLGLEIGKALAAKGAKVHICGRRPQVLEEAARYDLRRRGCPRVPSCLRRARRRSGRVHDGRESGPRGR